MSLPIEARYPIEVQMGCCTSRSEAALNKPGRPSLTMEHGNGLEFAAPH